MNPQDVRKHAARLLGTFLADPEAFREYERAREARAHGDVDALLQRHAGLPHAPSEADVNAMREEMQRLMQPVHEALRAHAPELEQRVRNVSHCVAK